MEQPVEWRDPEDKPWYEVSFDELGVHANAVPQLPWLEGEWPDWVAHVARELVKTFLPVAKLGGGMEMTPRRLGAFFGHQLAALNELSKFAESAATQKAFGAPLPPRDEFAQRYVEGLLKYFEDLGNTMKGACASAIDADYAECREFFSALSAAMKLRPSDVSRTNTRILLALLVRWRAFEQFPSIHAVHQAFCKAMNPHVVGNLKRFEKVCQRIGFSVRGRGRPRKAEKMHKFRRGKR